MPLATRVTSDRPSKPAGRPIPFARAVLAVAVAILFQVVVAYAQERTTPRDAPPGQRPKLTTDTGRPVGTDQHSLTAGPEGPTLLEHFYLLEKLARFDRERIPERVVHARGAGARGEFVSYADHSALTRAAFLSAKGKTVPVFARFSTVVLPKGSADTARDVRGFAVKFYTEEGNYDLVGNDIPVFFIRDAIKFPDLLHSLKPSPVTNVQEAERFFDFFSALPETTHMLTFLFSDQGTPASFRQMDGFGVNSFKWVNDKGDVHYIKYRWKSDQGVKTLTDEEAKVMGGKEPASLTKDLYDALKAGIYPSWELQVQALRPDELNKLDFDALDATKLWPESIVAFKPIGKMTIRKGPDNFFEETEQVAFNTGAYVPGIEPSEDRLLQGRNFSYSDTQRYRLGTNYQQLPINRPIDPVHNVNQEGLADHMTRKGDINYSPSTRQPEAPVEDKRALISATPLKGPVQYSAVKDPKDYDQAGERIRGMNSTDRDHLIHNLTGEMRKVKNREVVVRQIANFTRADADFGRRLAEANGVDFEKVKKTINASVAASR